MTQITLSPATLAWIERKGLTLLSVDGMNEDGTEIFFTATRKRGRQFFMLDVWKGQSGGGTIRKKDGRGMYQPIDTIRDGEVSA